jgi:hypothetical protein
MGDIELAVSLPVAPQDLMYFPFLSNLATRALV